MHLTEQIDNEQDAGRQAGADDGKDYVSLAVINRLPHWRCQDEGADLPLHIVGSRIIGFGAAPVETGIEGGGLIIDYVPEGSDDVRRVVLGFNELGMWVVHSTQS